MSLTATDGSIVASARGVRVGRAIRSLSVSAITTGLSLTILAGLTQLTSTAPAVANVIATVAGIGPSLALNRRWAWKRIGAAHVRREIIPFWTYALAALVISTLSVDRAAAWSDSVGASPLQQTLIVLAANVASFGVLWCGQFVLLERLFVEPSSETGPT